MPIMRGCAVNPGRCGNVRNAPCKGCQEREIACHTMCGRYKEFCERNEQAKERKRAAKRNAPSRFVFFELRAKLRFIIATPKQNRQRKLTAN